MSNFCSKCGHDRDFKNERDGSQVCWCEKEPVLDKSTSLVTFWKQETERLQAVLNKLCRCCDLPGKDPAAELSTYIQKLQAEIAGFRRYVEPSALTLIKHLENERDEALAHAKVADTRAVALMKSTDEMHAELSNRRQCSTCCGQPHASGLPCICGGTNNADEELKGLRLAAMKQNDQFDIAFGSMQARAERAEKCLRVIKEYRASISGGSSGDEQLLEEIDREIDRWRDDHSRCIRTRFYHRYGVVSISAVGAGRKTMSEQTKTCGNCKHWGVKPEEKIMGELKQDAIYRTCSAVIHDELCLTKVDYDDAIDQHGDPRDEEELAEIASFRKAHHAAVVDGSGYFAALKVREDFGCIDWEEKKHE